VSPLAAPPFDVTVPHPARVQDYLLGGKDSYQADRAAADAVLKAGFDIAASARAGREFLTRAVRHLAAEAGIRQFLDIGTGIPAAGNVHEVAQLAAPASRVVYTDNDPVVMAHVRALLDQGHAAGGIGYTEADLRDPAAVIDGAGDLLDFSMPAAVLMSSVLEFVPDGDDPAGLLAAYRAALAPGSYLVIAHATGDFHPAGAAGAAVSAFAGSLYPLTLRPRAVIESFFGGFTLEPPGLVQPHRWRPDSPDPGPAEAAGMYAGAARR
jgi:SAM-dependent methyltransferase